jgi:F0F1-type ATP synthase membrane subunit c/vacuolar-type H+-ATPase subunit K
VNEYFNDPKAATEGSFVADYLGAVLTCGITGLGAALEP